MIAVAITNHTSTVGTGRGGVWPVVVVLVAIVGMFLTMWLLSGYDRPDDDSGGSGPGGPPPDPPPTPPGPSWWPQFERDFAAYAAAVGRRRRRERAHAP